MNKRIICVALIIILFSFTFIIASADVNDKVHLLRQYKQGDIVKVWVYFIDKGSGEVALSKKVPVSEKALLRRLIRGAGSDLNNVDREVNRSYLDQITPRLEQVRHKSRWLNAVSAEIRYENIAALSRLDFIKEIREVVTYRRALPVDQRYHKIKSDGKPTKFDYGDSFGQLDQINVIYLHEQGLSGDGVIILMLDTGFKITHPAFAHLDLDSTWDFINNDVDVEDPDGNLLQQAHGTNTLSIIGSLTEGALIGVAYNATFLLAKTERRDEEIQIEEDAWVAAVEWGENLGADVISSSLGYTDWYTYEDMDGNTAVTTIAADLAVQLGVIVVNSMGNGHRTASQPTIIAPADGDSVIAVGAVAPNGSITDFSSNGPSFDGRIKPDVCAQGSSVRIADHNDGFSFSAGTSFSCPLVAGVVALLLEEHPEWNYGQVYQALTSTASQADNPDSVYGYGIINALAASGSDSTVEEGKTVVYPNPFSESVTFKFPVTDAGDVSIQIYTVAAEKVITIGKTFFSPTNATFSWSGRNESGEEVAAGIYIALISGPGIDQKCKILKR